MHTQSTREVAKVLGLLDERTVTDALVVTDTLGLAERPVDEHRQPAAARLIHGARPRLVAMKAGRVVAEGTPHEFVNQAVVRDVFGLDSHVITDPVSGTPLVLPISRRTSPSTIPTELQGAASS